MEDLKEENTKLKERVQYLENILNRGNSGNSTAYNAIRGMIINKVENEIDFSQYDKWQKKNKRQRYERKLMSDLIWELHVRRVSGLRVEHIKPAEEFIKNYKFEEVL